MYNESNWLFGLGTPHWHPKVLNLSHSVFLTGWVDLQLIGKPWITRTINSSLSNIMNLISKSDLEHLKDTQRYQTYPLGLFLAGWVEGITLRDLFTSSYFLLEHSFMVESRKLLLHWVGVWLRWVVAHVTQKLRFGTLDSDFKLRTSGFGLRICQYRVSKQNFFFMNWMLSTITKLISY